MSTPNVPRGPGLFEVPPDPPFVVEHVNGEKYAFDNFRRLDGVHLEGAERQPGSVLIGWAAWLLAALGGGLLFVSFAGQFRYIFLARHQSAASLIEALMFDVGMIIFSLLALGLARAGKPARTERTLIMACSAGSAAMNYAAADTSSPRSVVAYVAAPVFLAVVVDRVIAVIRRHVLGDDEASAWTALGRAVVAAVRLSGMTALYSARFVLAPAETAAGLRRMVLAAAPLPGLPAAELPQAEREDLLVCPVNLSFAGFPDVPCGKLLPCPDHPAIDPPKTKKARLLALYRAHPDYGNRSAAAKVAAELAPQVDLSAGTARAYLGTELGRVS